MSRADAEARLGRRAFLAAAALGGLGVVSRLAAQDSAGGLGGAAPELLRDPSAAGRARRPTSELDNEAAIRRIELQLTCNCGCTLDIYTCRTTDFTCTVSPELHRDIVARYSNGETAEQIITAFVEEYGEQVLMAPKPEGFNLAGYLVPGTVITLAGGTLAWFIGRRRQVALAGAAGAMPPAGALEADGAPLPSDGAGFAVSGDPTLGLEAEAAALGATPEELERLRRALAEVED